MKQADFQPVLIAISFSVVAGIVLNSCQEKAVSPAAPTVVAKRNTAIAQQAPSATEIFNIRTECAKLGKKIMSDNLLGSALTQSQISHYNFRENRCYVELTVQSSDLGQPAKVLTRYLIDGQTEEQLAFAGLKNGTYVGIVFNGLGDGFVAASDFIDKKMRAE